MQVFVDDLFNPTMLGQRKDILKHLKTIHGDFHDQLPNEYVNQAGYSTSGFVVTLTLHIPTTIQNSMLVLIKWALLWEDSKFLG